jgi:cardiolipin synthase
MPRGETGRLYPDPRELVPGHRVTLLRDGAEAYPRMLEAIRSAREHVLLEMYIFAADAAGLEFRRALVEKAREGVPVRVMYDSVGSSDTPRDFFGELRAAGCLVNEYHPFHGMLLDPRRRRRNHRKLIVVDGRVAFAGGLNIANEYAREWRDTAVEVRGPIVADLAYMFLDIWQKEERKSPRLPTPPIPPPEGPMRAVALSSDRWTNRWRLARAYRHAVQNARSRVWISNAYFVPSNRFLKLLRRGASRGADVRILVPAKTDLMPVYYATRATFGRLLRAGVRIFEWQGKMMHAKTAVVDGEWATVGSYNIDHLSLMQNLELSIIVCDREFGAAMERMFEDDLRASTEVDRASWRRRPWRQKLLERLFWLFRTLL